MKLKTNSKSTFYIVLYLLFLSDLAILLDIFILRQVLAFFLITILPGFLILQIFKLNQIQFTEKLLLIIGTSISFLMFVGLFTNIFFPHVGILNPISIFPLLFTLNISIIALSIIGYKTDALLSQVSYNSFRLQKLIVPIVFLLNIPVVASLGALVVLHFENSIFSLFFILLVVLIVVLITFNKFIPENLYPLSIFVISFGLLLNRTLTSPYLFGSDIHYEYYFAQLVKNSSHWDYSLSENVNAMLSVTILPNIYSILLNINLIYVYKIVYSFLFSFVPVGLYHIYSSQMQNKDAFLSAFFSMSFYAFFIATPWLPRQQIAELYVVLITMVLFIKTSSTKKPIFFIIFISSLIVSHYGTSYIFLLYMICVFIGSIVIKATDKTISDSKLLLSLVILFSWYIYVSSSSIFSSVANIADHIYSVVTTEMFSSGGIDPDIAKGVGVGIQNLEFLHAIGNVWVIITELLIFIGLFYIIKYRHIQFNQEYLLFCLVNMGFILMCIILPYLASSLLMYRVYQITLLFLSPFCIFGVEAILKIIFSILGSNHFPLKFSSAKYVVLMIVLIPYFLFNTGFVYEIAENPSSYNVNLSPIDKNSDINYYSKWSYFTASPIPKQDVFACRWISDKIGPIPLYVDELRRCEITGYGLILNTRELTPNTPKNQVVYLGYLNIIDGVASRLDPQKVHSAIKYNITEITPSLESRNKIYTNNGSVFYI